MNKTALQYSITLISKRDYSEYKLHTKLSEKRYSENEIKEAILKLKSMKYLRDAVLAEDRAISMLYKNYGNKLIHIKLEQENLFIEEEKIQELRLERDLEIETVIDSLIIKKMNQNKGIDLLKLKFKINNYIMSKGFESSLIEEKIEHFLC